MLRDHISSHINMQKPQLFGININQENIEETPRPGMICNQYNHNLKQRKLQNLQFIATRPILGLCEVTDRRPGTRVPRRWWEHTGIDWKAAREKAAAKDGWRGRTRKCHGVFILP